MSKPRRVQLSRSRCWRMPANSVKVDRTTRWGNPFKIGSAATHPTTGRRVRIDSSVTSIAPYKAWLTTARGKKIAREARHALKGRNVACWCRPGTPCHGDVLLRLVNDG